MIIMGHSINWPLTIQREILGKFNLSRSIIIPGRIPTNWVHLGCTPSRVSYRWRRAKAAFVLEIDRLKRNELKSSNETTVAGGHRNL